MNDCSKTRCQFMNPENCQIPNDKCPYYTPDMSEKIKKLVKENSVEYGFGFIQGLQCALESMR